jgi:KaiC/GvpD/RAD55 family RecA-like ATPase
MALIASVLLMIPLSRGQSSPVAFFTFSPNDPAKDENVTFDASGSYDTEGTIISYEWSFGDGANGTGTVISHVFTAVGVYTVTLKITDNNGLSGFTSQILRVNIHDVSITDIVLPLKEVYQGQVVNITVVVKNEGTTAETFNVTLYGYYPAEIGKQQVFGLEANTAAFLVFSWDTRDVMPDAGYILEAKATLVRGETDTRDNRLYSNDYIMVKSQPAQQSPLQAMFNQILPYALSIIFLGSLTGGIVWRKWRTGSTPIGFEFFDDLTGGGIPETHSVMISGDAGSGKSVFCQQLAYRYLQQGKPCLYVTYDNFPDEIRENMKNLRWNTSQYEQNEALKFIDCYSAMSGNKCQEKHCVMQPYSLSDLGIALSKAMDEIKQKSAKVFLDSATPLFMRLNPSEVLEFMQDRIAKIKADGGTFLFTIGKQTVSQDITSGLDEIADCIIELSVQTEKEGKTSRKLHIKRLRGRGFRDMRVPFKIDPAKGLMFLPPRKTILPKRKAKSG